MKKGHGIRPIHKSDVYINETRKCAWLTNPKVASTSIRKNLVVEPAAQTASGEPFRLVQLSELTKKNTKRALAQLQDYYFFSFVRHPESRLLSAYRNKVDRYLPPKNVYRIKQQILEYLDRDITDINQKVSFDDFIESITRQQPSDLNRHWQPQTLVLEIDAIDYGYIGKLETFRESWEELCRQLHINTADIASLFEKQPFKQSTASTPIDINSRTRALIEDYFSEDYRSFGYE